ncbi:MAG TPA: GntR family transcriptional regulator [Candidatus Acidoferrum sp.]|nr:GntR family transcriptional regulator [Candidatus Acidoferrum sp.]
MRFWITKNSELPVREQLVRQVVLGILSEDLAAGHKLPSVRALARRHHIHANTVSAAYHDLLQQGWLELRRGSGLFVRPQQPSNGPREGLDQLLTALLQSARSLGHEPEEVLQRLEHLVRPKSYRRIVIVEPDPAMREIVQAEIAGQVEVAVETASELEGAAAFDGAVVVALPTRAAKLRRMLPDGILFVPLRLHSVRESLESETRPGRDVVISIVSRSPEIRYWARAMLIAVGLDVEALCEIDAAKPNWRDRVAGGGLVVTDTVTSREIPANCRTRIFRIIADSSLNHLRQLCGCDRS